MGVCLGLPLRSVVIGPSDPRFAGWALFRRYPASKRLQLGIMYAAGAAADGLEGRDEPWAWGPDFQYITQLGFTTGERRLLVEIATHYLSGRVRRQWGRVTSALEDRNLSGAEVRALVLHGEEIEP